jgi:hypothetical protein
MTRRKHRAPPSWTYHYDGRDMVASLEAAPEGWTVRDPVGVVLGVFPTREYALAFINARIAGPPALPVAGEREADAKRVKRIQMHQRHAREHRARRAGRR